jgi:hypothetical protein
MTQRETFERELLKRDKQSIITYSLKTFDKLEMVDKERTILNDKNKGYLKQIQTQAAEINRLNSRTLWQVINERLQIRIDAIRARRAK